MDPVSITLTQWLIHAVAWGSGGALLWFAGLMVQQSRLRRRDRDDFELMARIIDGDQPDAPLMLKSMATIFKARREHRSRLKLW